MTSLKTKFADQLRQGKANAKDIDDFIDVWHRGGTGVPLHEFLGLTLEQYARWVEKPDSLVDVARKPTRRCRYSLDRCRRASAILSSVTDPTPLQIVLLLSERASDVATISNRLEASKESISHHLALLRHGGMIAVRKHGQHNIYSLTKNGEKWALLVGSLTS